MFTTSSLIWQLPALITLKHSSNLYWMFFFFLLNKKILPNYPNAGALIAFNATHSIKFIFIFFTWNRLKESKVGGPSVFGSAHLNKANVAREVSSIRTASVESIIIVWSVQTSIAEPLWSIIRNVSRRGLDFIPSSLHLLAYLLLLFILCCSDKHWFKSWLLIVFIRYKMNFCSGCVSNFLARI